MNLTKIALPIVTIGLLSGCKVSDKAPGVWYGVAFDNATGSYSEVAMFITELGETRISTTAGFYLAGPGFFDGDIMYNLPLSNYGSTDFTSINYDTQLLVTGEFTDASVSLEVKDEDEVVQNLDLIRSTDAIATQAQYAGSWYANPHAPDPAYTWLIDEDGNIGGNDELGCLYSGKVTASDTINVAELNLVITECVYEGAYHGIMSLFLSPDSDRIGIFYNYSNLENIFVNGLEKIL